MNRRPNLDGFGIALNRYDDDEGYASGTEATLTPPATPTNTPAGRLAYPLEEPPEIPLDELPVNLLDGQPGVLLNEQPGQPEGRPGGFWPDPLIMATLCVVYFLLLMDFFPRPREAFNLVAIHLVWVTYAVYGLSSPNWPRTAVWISGLFALTALAVTQEGAHREASGQGEYFYQSAIIALLVTAGTLLLFLDRAAMAVVGEIAEAREELRRGGELPAVERERLERRVAMLEPRVGPLRTVLGYH